MEHSYILEAAKLKMDIKDVQIQSNGNNFKIIKSDKVVLSDSDFTQEELNYAKTKIDEQKQLLNDTKVDILNRLGLSFDEARLLFG